MDGAICFECIEDLYLREEVRSTGTIARCSICSGSSNSAFTIEALAERLFEVFRQHLERAPEQIYEGYPEHGDDLTLWVEHILNQEIPFADELVEGICGLEDSYPDEPYWSTDYNYVESPLHRTLATEKMVLCLNAIEARAPLF